MYQFDAKENTTFNPTSINHGYCFHNIGQIQHHWHQSEATIPYFPRPPIPSTELPDHSTLSLEQ
jgi:hypothetical protein